MAAAFPQERSTKDVINTILDDYEKRAKYVLVASILVVAHLVWELNWICSVVLNDSKLSSERLLRTT